jgi:hypothetical protein
MDDLRTSLDGLKSRNSLLLVFSPSENDRFCMIHRELFSACEYSLRGHGLVLAEIFEQGNSHLGAMDLDSDSCDYLRRQFHIIPGQFKVLLLGKDQHIKLTSDSFVSERELLIRLEATAPEGIELVFS